MSDALVLAGGVAKGAFAAGACAVLFEQVPDLDVTRVVATSAGAMNAAFLTPAIRSGTARAAGRELEALWRERATFGDVFDPTVRGLARLEGFSTSAKVLDLLRRYVRPATGRRPVDLRVVTTATSGTVTIDEDGRTATTFERALHFDGATFDDPQRLEAMFHAVTASAAFPGAFVPVRLPLDGSPVACFDGGLVNETPIKHAIDATDVDRVFVVVPFPGRFHAEPVDARGLGLVEHLAEILVNERLYRDLREARRVNRALEELEARVGTGRELADALRVLGWTGRRRLEIVEVRPHVALEGGVFDGFFDRELRDAYVRAGHEAARVALGVRGSAA